MVSIINLFVNIPLFFNNFNNNLFYYLVNPLVEYEFHLIGFGIGLILLIGTYIFARKKHKEVIISSL